MEASYQLRIRSLHPDENLISEAVLVELAAEGQILAETPAIADGLNARFNLC